MRISDARVGPAFVLAASGRIDITTSDTFSQAMLAKLAEASAAGEKLVLDFTGVDYISSAGLRVLMVASKQARALQAKFSIAGLQPVVGEIFQISRFDKLIPCYASVEDAIADAPDVVAGGARKPVAGASAAEGISVRFWGTRGSLPTPLAADELEAKLVQALVAGAGRNLDNADKARAFLQQLPFHQRSTFGGNSACVELSADGNSIVLLDMGSGARLAGREALRRLAGKPGEFHVFMSHLHWDHIMGFPFFVPAYIPGQQIRIYGCHAQLEHAFRRQQAEPSFPVDFSMMGARIEFVMLEPGLTYDIAGYRVQAKLQLHGGDSYGYRFEKNDKVVVYSTDAEHKPEHADDIRGFVELFKDADLVVFDAMYSLAESVSVKEDWGHSSNVVGVELCQQAGARRLALFHHEPVNDDAAIENLWREAMRLEEITRRGDGLDVIAAYDGLEIEV